jgi:hypothetical protein
MLEWLEEATFVLADVLLEMRQGQEGEATALEAIRASGQYGGTSIAPRSLGPVKELLRVVEMRRSLFEGNGVQWGQ